MNEPSEKVHRLRALIEESSKIVVFTGAGISTESGISDYRSQGGLWQRYQPVTIQEFLADEEKRREYWRRKKEMYVQIRDAKPNLGHLAIARLERRGGEVTSSLLGVITQNIDGLHKKAGNKNVLEIHGTNLEVICLDCQETGSFEPVYKRLLAGEAVPICLQCKGLLKPNTISFGQPLDPHVISLAMEWSRACDLMIAAGSTLIVEPAASLPVHAKESGAHLVIINRDPTPLDYLADLVFHTDLGPLLDHVID